MMEGGGGRGEGGKATVLGRLGGAGCADGGRASGEPAAGAHFALPARGDPNLWCVRGAVVTLSATGHWVEVPAPVALALHQTWGCGEGVALEARDNEPRRISRATPGRPLCRSLYDALPATPGRACGWLGWQPPEATRAGRPAGQRTLRGRSRR